jgi:hypothetical protein
MERTIKGIRGCITTGHKSIDAFSHCGNDKCVGCNMYEDAVKEVLNKQLKEYEKPTNRKSDDSQI